MHICLNTRKRAKILDNHVHTKHFFIQQAVFKEEKENSSFRNTRTHTQMKTKLSWKRKTWNRCVFLKACITMSILLHKTTSQREIKLLSLIIHPA